MRAGNIRAVACGACSVRHIACDKSLRAVLRFACAQHGGIYDPSVCARRRYIRSISNTKCLTAFHFGRRRRHRHFGHDRQNGLRLFGNYVCVCVFVRIGCRNQKLDRFANNTIDWTEVIFVLFSFMSSYSLPINKITINSTANNQFRE